MKEEKEIVERQDGGDWSRDEEERQRTEVADDDDDDDAELEAKTSSAKMK